MNAKTKVPIENQDEILRFCDTVKGCLMEMFSIIPEDNCEAEAAEHFKEEDDDFLLAVASIVKTMWEVHDQDKDFGRVVAIRLSDSMMKSVKMAVLLKAFKARAGDDG